MNFEYRRLALAALFCCFAVGSSDAAMLINGFSAPVNDRFTNSSFFVANGYDLSGVARRDLVAESSSAWGTLIAPNAVLSANHRRASGTMVFYPTNDPSSTPVVRTVVSGGMRVGSTDLYISFLNADVPSSIKVYDFATETITASPSGPAGSLQGDDVFMVGRSSSSNTNAPTNQAVGRNKITGFLDNVVFGSGTNVDALFMRYDAGTSPDFLPSEAWVRGGDSGAPLFTVDNGELLLLGVNSFQLSFENDTSQYSGVSYTGNVDSEINSILLNYTVPVPEPSGIAILVCLSFATGFRRRRV